MNVQIGDIVLVTSASKHSRYTYVGAPCAAIVVEIFAHNEISCSHFHPNGEIQFLEHLPHARLVDEGHSYWDFRPSQKEPPPVVKAELKNSAKFNITQGQPNLYWDINLRKVEIKPRPYFENKPALGTFEWALVALKNGHKVRRLGWSDKTLAVKCEYNFLRFTDDDVFPDDSNDLLATDWVLA